MSDANPEKGVVKALDKDNDGTYQIKVGNATIDVRELTAGEVKEREWEKFNKKYDRKIMIVVNSLKQHNFTCLALTSELGDFNEYKGLWDAFIPDSNFTVPKILQKKAEEEDLTPLKYFIGVDNSVSDEVFNSLKQKFLRFKLLY